MFPFVEEDEEEDDFQTRVKYAVILQREDYEDEEEEDPIPYVDLGPGYFFLDVQ